MWTCPKCKQKFYNRNQSHSCGNFTLEGFLAGKTEKAIKLLHAFLGQYARIGKYELHPVKTRVALLTKMRFASVNKLGKAHLDGHLVLTERSNASETFYKIDNLNNRFFVHHFRLYEEKDITSVLLRAMKRAYQVGQRRHVGEKRKA